MRNATQDLPFASAQDTVTAGVLAIPPDTTTWTGEVGSRPAHSPKCCRRRATRLPCWPPATRTSSCTTCWSWSSARPVFTSTTSGAPGRPAGP